MPAGVASGRLPAVAPPPIAERRVFSAGGETYGWTGILEAARARGDWASLERQTVAGLACSRRQATSGEPLDRAALDELAKRFRESRGLLAGDEMKAWLAHWGLDVPDLRDYLVRAHLRERWDLELDETMDRYPVSLEQVAASLWPEAVCSGLLERSARTFAADVALALESGDGPLQTDGSGIARILAVADRARLRQHGEDAIAREVGANRLEWHRVTGESLALRSLDAAREAALMVREDGLALDDVALRSGGELHRFDLYLSEVADEEAVALLGAQEGDLIGPRPRHGRFVVERVTRKKPPSPADPEIRGMAIARLRARAVERATSAHVEWHERL